MNRRSIFTIIWSALREIWTGEIPDKYFIYEDEEDWGPIPIPEEGTVFREIYDNLMENALREPTTEDLVPRGLGYWINHET